jgi:small-conductance mechanosensitive channel
MEFYLSHWRTWAWSGGGIVAAALLGLIVHKILFAIARRFARHTTSHLDDSFIRHGERPVRLILPLLMILAALPLLSLTPFTLDAFRHVVGLGIIGAIAWLAIALIEVFDDLVAVRYAVDVSDNLMARRIQTQVEVLRHIAVVVIIIITLAIMLMTFPNIRHVGESLFASAGLAALVAGLAARTTLSNLLAGVQIALTQPMRLDDVVIVEGEWGWIEEINTTYVVVRIWDLRRLVVPLSYFIEKPFQNWTRKTADLLGTVFLYTDYTVPVEEVRQELHRILQSSGMWDEKVWGLQVTDAKEHTLELRALMSAPNGSAAWDLRCFVREKLVEFMQKQYPESLPKTRAELVRKGGDELLPQGTKPQPGEAA